MTREEKMAVKEMYNKGMGYKKISTLTGLSVGSVRNLLKTFSVSTTCKNCGKPVEQKEKTKKKVFCCGKCRMDWWNMHQDQLKHKTMIELVCPECGKTFAAYPKKKRKFCSKDCYYKHRNGGESHD